MCVHMRALVCVCVCVCASALYCFVNFTLDKSDLFARSIIINKLGSL
jgi:hypothetical protein